MTNEGNRRAAYAWVAAGLSVAVGAAAGAQDVPATVEPGVIEQEFQTPRDAAADGAVSVPAASGPRAPAGAENETFVLMDLEVDGVSALPPSDIVALYSDKIGREITLSELFEVAQDITKLYADADYPLSVAFVPAQEISNGSARIVVYEGYVAEVEVTGDAGAARSALEGLGAQLMQERPISSAVLERYVLLANDLPGISVQAVIDRSPGEPGAVKVIFAVERKQTDFALNLSNRGSRALGPGRVQASAAVNGLALPGDRLRGDIVQTTDGDELSFISAGYDAPIGDDGFRLGIFSSWSDSEPGTPFLESLGFNSDGWTAGVEGSYPLIRRRSHNVILAGSFEYKELESRFDSIVNSNDVLWVGRVSVSMDRAGLAGAISSLSVEFSKGFNIGAATEASDINKSRARGSGEFMSLVVDAGRVQPLAGPLELAVAGRAQIAGRKLLASEECGYGGAGIGRAFDNFEISGDHCLMGTAELRMRSSLFETGQVTGLPYGFVDAGRVWTHGAAPAGQPAEDNAQSIGGGIRLGIGEYVSAYVEYAHPISHEIALEGDEDGRVFFGLTARR